MTFGKFLDPKNDFAFKRIFGTEKNKDILIHFLNDMLDFKVGKRITKVDFLKTTQDPKVAYKKQSIVDVLCRDEQGSQYIVEMQVAYAPGFEKRAQFYAARAYANQMKVGEAYHELKEIIFLAITDFVMFPEKPGYYSTHVTLDADTLTRDLKDFSFSFLELPKFNKTVDQLETLIDKWAYFFKHASHIGPEALDKLIGDDLILKQAYHALDQFYWTEEELNTYEQELKSIRDGKAIRDYQLHQANQHNLVIEKVNQLNLVIEQAKATLEETEAKTIAAKEEAETAKAAGIAAKEEAETAKAAAKAAREEIEAAKAADIAAREEAKAAGIAEGVAEGKAEGEEEAKWKIAKKLFEEGLKAPFIATVTGLPENMIESLCARPPQQVIMNQESSALRILP